MSMYRTGRVYKIVHTQSDIVYVGSTFNTIRDRFREHKKANKDGGYCSITPYIQQYGANQFKMILIKEYQVCDRKHLQAYEQLWLNKLVCINKNHPFQISKLWHKQYREANKEIIAERQRQYYEANKERYKQYYETHKEQINEQKRQSWTCDICNITYRSDSKARHLKSNKHQKNMNQQK